MSGICLRNWVASEKTLILRSGVLLQSLQQSSLSQPPPLSATPPFQPPCLAHR
jgi:hypothetical protein